MSVRQLPAQPSGYNEPTCIAMLLAQHAHQRYLDGKCSYEEYQAFQRMAYQLFPPERVEEPS